MIRPGDAEADPDHRGPRGIHLRPSADRPTGAKLLCTDIRQGPIPVADGHTRRRASWSIRTRQPTTAGSNFVFVRTVRRGNPAQGQQSGALDHAGRHLIPKARLIAWWPAGRKHDNRDVNRLTYQPGQSAGHSELHKTSSKGQQLLSVPSQWAEHGESVNIIIQSICSMVVASWLRCVVASRAHHSIARPLDTLAVNWSAREKGKASWQKTATMRSQNNRWG